MSKALLFIWFLLLLNILTYSACASKSTAEAGDSRTPKPQVKPNLMESSKPGNQRTIPGVRVLQHTSIWQRTKAPNGGGVNDVRPPHDGRRNGNSSKYSSIKPSSLFMAALRHLIFGLLLVVGFF